MVNPREVLGVVHARGGSKGLPGKNVRPLAGHPLVAYSVASGRAAKSITRLLISTDCPEIAEIGRAYGAEAPFLRPAEMAGDDSPDLPLFVHALAWLKEREGYEPEAVVQLRPTTPFRPRGMVDAAVDLLWSDPQADCVRGVTAPKQTPYKMWRDGGGGYLAPLLSTEFPEPYNMPRQSLPPAYFQTGHIDAIRTRTIHQQNSLTGKLVRPLMIDPMYCVDIDTPDDFEQAERLLQRIAGEIDMPAVGVSRGQRTWPTTIDLVVFDFDGVHTDNRVLVLEDGREAVFCDRGDGMGISLLRQRGVPVMILSTERNVVVQARCDKLKISCIHGSDDKLESLRSLCASRDISMERVVYVGNDINDLGCMQAVGFAVAVADAQPQVLLAADLILTRPGGFGAVREFSELLLNHLQRNS